MIRQINLSDIRIDGRTQHRAVNENLVKEYAAKMAEGDEFPPVEVIYDGFVYWLWDGFHRYHATRVNKRAGISAFIRTGTGSDAIWLSYSANSKHGLALTADEKRDILYDIFNNPEHAGKSISEIARHTGQNRQMVRQRRDEVIARNSQQNGAGTSASPEVVGNNENDDELKIAVVSEKAVTHYDRVGQEIPPHLVDVWLKAGVIKQKSAELKEILTYFERLVENREPAMTHIRIGPLKNDIERARSSIKAGRPYAVCVVCGGDGRECRACKGSGFMTMGLYENAPKD